MKKSALVIFNKNFSPRDKARLLSIPQCEVIFSPLELKEEVEALGCEWHALEDFVEAGSIYEANIFLQELSLLTLSDGTRLSKACLYKGYELWWNHYTNLFLQFCLPYTQYKRLLTYIQSFDTVYLYEAPFSDLFSRYLEAHASRPVHVRRVGLSLSSWLPFGVLIQIILTCISVPIIALARRPIVVHTGDKFDGQNDFDFRMKFIYGELRKQKVPFVEFIRSLESWKIVLEHAVRRKRPIIYTEAIVLLGRYVSLITGGRYRSARKYNPVKLVSTNDPNLRFKFLLATQYLRTVSDDIWGIRMMKCITRLTGVRAAFIPMASERNFQTVLACKLNKIPTVGILHGVASEHYNVHDFTQTFDGRQVFSVDRYGVWSEWWKSYYEENSRAYRKGQLYISGPMRPMLREADSSREEQDQKKSGQKKILFVSEQLAVPEEVFPYLRALLSVKDIEVRISFRPYRDGFELWLKQYHPEIFEKIGEDRIVRSGIKDAIKESDMVIGTHSTAVLEALLEVKPIAFFATHKWGDYFNLKGYHREYTFYAENIDELVKCVMENDRIPKQVLIELRERFFGNPYQNGSAWVVNQLIEVLERK